MVKVSIKTQGCSHNYSDSEHMAGLLQQAGHELVSEDDADVVLFNTCTVKTPTEHTFLRDLHSVKKSNKKIILGGCIPQAEPARFAGYSIIGTRQLDNVVDVVERTAAGERVQLLRRNRLPVLSSPIVRRDPLIETIPISVGCLSACSFCKTKHARGQLKSYSIAEIVDRVRSATSQGVKEVQLTSQDTGCYGFDHGTNAALLLKEICKIEKDFRIRFGMGNPDHLLKISPELIDAYRNDKVYKFLHLPVQAGNDTVLNDMKRAYTVADFRKIVTAFRSVIPRITIATDVICGFPTETVEQFENTLQLVRDVKPDVINLSRFWPRQGTAAAQMKQLPGSEVKRRSGLLTQLQHEISLERNRGWIGWKGNVLITGEGKHGTMLGRNFAYKQIVIEESVKKGQHVNVLIVDAALWDLRGTVT